MRLLHRISAVLLSFCLSWGLTQQFRRRSEISGSNKSSAPFVKPSASPISSAADSKQNAKALIAAFSNNAPIRWSEIWVTFAEKATPDELQTLLKTSLDATRGVREVLRILAEEELSLRQDSPILQRHGVAALAEINPEAAWKAVGKARASMVSAAVLRTLAMTDPAAALEKYRHLGLERGPEWNGENDVVHGPLASIFAAWTRRDPAAAMAAAASLPEKQKHTAQQEIALTLAYSDGAAALKYSLANNLLEEDRNNHLSALLRAVFSQPPTAARTAVIQAHPEIFKGRETYDFLGPWLRMDRAGALEFISKQQLNIRSLGLVIELAPAAALQVAQNNGFGAAKNYPYLWERLYRHYPNEVQDLAGQQGCWAEVKERLEKDGAKLEHPTVRLQNLLDRLSKEGVEKVAQSMPLTGQTPAQQLEIYLECAKRFLPEAVPTLESFLSKAADVKRKPYYTHENPLSEELFAYDPAAAAQRLTEKPLATWDAWHAVDYWAPYDFPAAMAWVASLPDGQAKHYAEISLLEHQANPNGEELLTKLLAEDPAPYYRAKISSAPSAKLTETWKKGLRAVARQGGDWRTWLEKLPATYRADDVTRTQFDYLEDELVRDEKEKESQK